MKKIINSLLILSVVFGLMIFSLAIAENPGAENQGQDVPQSQGQQGEQQGEDKDQGNQQGNGDEEDENGEESQQQEQEREQIQEQEQEQSGNGLIDSQNGQQLRAKTSNEFKSMIKEKRGEMIEEIKSMKGNLQKAYENQNEVRMAVHGLLAMETLVGGDIGPKVSKIARQFNNSVEESIKAEETIRNRNRIVRFFAGGDQETAEELQNLVGQNRIRIQELKELKNQADCEEEVKTLMQEQIQSMELGQVKLQETIQNEKNARGIWGWFKGLFGK